MKKRAKILLIIIIIVAALMGLLYLISLMTGMSMTGNAIGFLQKSEVVDQAYIESSIQKFIDKANKEEKYLKFIADSEYDSMELIIAKQRYYIEYDSEKKKVMQTEEKETDFTMKISARKFNKVMVLYKEGKIKEAAMKVVGEIPRRVKISLFKQCMNTEWCKNGHF